MEQETTSAGPPGTPLAPPTTPGRIGTPARSGWPTVIGIIAVVFGVFGALSAAWQAASLYFIESFGAIIPAQAGGDPFAGTRRWRDEVTITSSILVLAAILLLVAGIVLLLRRRQAFAWMVGWAVFKILATVPAAIVTMYMQRDQLQSQFAAMQQSGGGGLPSTVGTAMAVVVAALMVLWSWALPVFVLIWMLRKKVRREIATW